MGYKLAGFDVLGGVELDPRMSALYVKNLKPKHEFVEGVGDFLARPDSGIPPELFDLALLDGSPPCSTFSVSGSRAKAWGKKKRFREGQASQVLDALPMAWVALALRLRPRVAVMENVTGMIKGDAVGFVREVVSAMRSGGYEAQVFKLDASRMGVAHRRERVFVICRRADLALAPLRLAFDEAPIAAEDVLRDLDPGDKDSLTPETRRLWACTLPGRSLKHAHLRGSRFNAYKLRPSSPANTIVSASGMFHWAEPRHLTGAEIRRLQSFPDDYDFLDQDPQYVCGMSVPPLMAQRLALELRRQWLG